MAWPVCAERPAARHRREAFDRASDRAQGPRPDEAFQRHQHGTHVRRQGDASGGRKHAAERDRPLGPDHQGLRPVRGLASLRALAAPDFPCPAAPQVAYGAARLTVLEDPMSLSRRTLLATLAATPFASLLSRPAFAAYPDKPIRLIVPFAA